MTNDPNDSRMYNVGCNFYELVTSNGYYPDDAKRLNDIVHMCVETSNGDELIAFYEALRDYAYVDSVFCNLLIETEIMTHEEIFGLDNIFDNQSSDIVFDAYEDEDENEDFDDGMEPEFISLSEDDYESFYGDDEE